MSNLKLGKDDYIVQLHYNDKTINTFLMVLDSIIRNKDYGFTRINGKLIKVSLEVEEDEIE
jgi:hypothetical protein